MGADPVLTAKGIWKRFGAVQALEDVSLEIQAGQVTGLVGANGAGKSTFAKILSGVHSPDSGQVLIRGVPRTHHLPKQATEDGVAVVHQDLNLQVVPQMSVADNMLLSGFPSRLGVIARATARRMAEDVLEELQAPPTIELDASFSTLSPVEQRLVMIAAASARRPRLVILDEPTAALPPAQSELVHSLVKHLAAQGAAVLLISHRLEEVEDLCHQVAVFRDGRLIATLHESEAATNRMIELMVGAGSAPLERAAQRVPTPPSNTPLLVASGLRGRRVRDAQVVLQAGEVLGLAGLVGAGQSELLRLLYGARGRHAGRVLVEGREVPARPAAAVHAGFGFATGNRWENVVPDMSVAENVSIPAGRRWVSAPFYLVDRPREGRYLERLLSAMGFKGEMQGPVSSLSGGNQQKVILARWLMAEVKVLLLDDPTAGIDVAGRTEVQRLVADFAAEGGGVIIASSEPEELAHICDRVLVLREGAVVREFHGPIDAAAIVEASFDRVA